MRLWTKRSPRWPATSPPATSTSTSSSRWTTPPSFASSATRRCSQLLQVFSGQVGGGKQPHLANFYLILPPLGSRLEKQCFQFKMCKKNILTILAAVNYIEHLTGAKEKIFKKVRSRHNQSSKCLTYCALSEPGGRLFHRGRLLDGSRLLPHPSQPVARGRLSALVGTILYFIVYILV